MAKVRTWVGLDVHAAKVVAATVDAESGELRFARLGGETATVVRFCARLPGPVRVAYEAGPTGFGLARALRAGVECVVAAPGKIARAAPRRVKTDRRDAERLVRLLMVGGLHPVRVPGPRRRRCATWSARARTCAGSDARPPPGRASCCCATTCASTARPGPSATATGWRGRARGAAARR